MRGKMKMNSTESLIWSSFVLSIILETLVLMEVIPDNKIVKTVQYIILLVPASLCLLVMASSRKGFRSRPFWQELRSGLILIFVFGILSLYKSYTAGRFTYQSIMQLFQIIVPFVFTYVLINEMNSDNIESFMKIALWVTTVGYLAAVIANLNSLTSVFNVSIFSSYSPFENSTCAEIASGLAAYFIYFRKKMPRYAFIAVVLNFLIFKRVLMLMAIILLIISLQGKQDEEVSKRMFKITFLNN